jgi:RsiW-degrading membrane proteinase PrsW (M82 family)
MTRALSRFPAAFVAAAAAPAFLTGLVFLVWSGPGGFAFGFILALALAGLHVLLLAVPIHFLLSRRRTPGPILVLISSFLIGALPLPLLIDAEALSTEALIFGLSGLSGGIAFLLMTGPREAFEDGPAVREER